MKIGNATTNWQTTPAQRSSSRGGSFAEQLQQATQKISSESSDPRAQKLRDIVGRYDLDNLNFNQCVKMVEDLGAAGILDLQEGSKLIPWEKLVLPNGENRTKEQLDGIIVNPKERLETLRDRAIWEGDQEKAMLARKSLKFYDEVLTTWHQLKGRSNTLSTRA